MPRRKVFRCRVVVFHWTVVRARKICRIESSCSRAAFFCGAATTRQLHPLHNTNSIVGNIPGIARIFTGVSDSVHAIAPTQTTTASTIPTTTSSAKVSHHRLVHRPPPLGASRRRASQQHHRLQPPIPGRHQITSSHHTTTTSSSSIPTTTKTTITTTTTPSSTCSSNISGWQQ